MERIMTWGHWAEEGILDLASFVASSGSAGLVSLGIGGLFAGVLGVHAYHSTRIEAAVRKAAALVRAAPDAAGFARDFKRIHEEFRFLGNTKGPSPRKSIWRGWRDFTETLAAPESVGRTGGIKALRNTVRPADFFNSEDLGFERGIWRSWPGVFVSVGLFATFLGIIAALKNLMGGAEIVSLNEETMGAFLDATKSKFIMSLTGLGASISFNLWYRLRQSAVDRQLAHLCDEIEDRVVFHTPEQIALDQLTTLQDMRKSLGMQVGDAVSERLSRDLDPILTKVNNSAGHKVGHLVEELGDRLHNKLNGSLDAVAETLLGISEAMDSISSRLERSGANVAQEMASGVGSLNDVLVRTRTSLLEDREALRAQREEEHEAARQALALMAGTMQENARSGAQSVAHVTQELTLATKGLQGSIRSAGTDAEHQIAATLSRMVSEAEGQMMTAGSDTTKNIAHAARTIMKELAEFQGGLRSKLGAPIQDLVDRLSEIDKSLASHTQHLGEAAQIQESASQRMAVAAQRMQDAGRPLSNSSAAISDASQAIQESLAASLQVIQASRRSAENSLGQIQGLVDGSVPLDAHDTAAVTDVLRRLEKGQQDIRAVSDQLYGAITRQLEEIRQALPTGAAGDAFGARG